MKTLHLKTQRDQPYGSERKCCEVCGVALVGRSADFWQTNAWTDASEHYHGGHENHQICATRVTASSAAQPAQGGEA